MSNTTTAPHGPQTMPTLQPGQRGSVMIVDEHPDMATAMEQSVAWIDALESDCGQQLDTDRTALYAVARVEDLTPFLDRGTTHVGGTGVAPLLDAILTGGQWKTRGDDAAAWAQTYTEALTTAAPHALCTVWDIYPHR
ncbi:hypothetical protein AB0O26_10625 [Micrococcus luteus]|uniref:hypothetical protein n=1 Tax=Micrococcus luteus TaxID=1270 RepID=UPI00343A7D4D